MKGSNAKEAVKVGDLPIGVELWPTIPPINTLSTPTQRPPSLVTCKRVRGGLFLSPLPLSAGFHIQNRLSYSEMAKGEFRNELFM